MHAAAPATCTGLTCCVYTRTSSHAPATSAAEALTPLLGDESARVQAFSALALGKLGHRGAMPGVLTFLEANAGVDVFLQHGGIMALKGIAQPAELAKLAQHQSRHVRLAAAIALRKLEHPDIAVYLQDPDTRIAEEALRALQNRRLARSIQAQDANVHFRLAEAGLPERFEEGEHGSRVGVRGAGLGAWLGASYAALTLQRSSAGVSETRRGLVTVAGRARDARTGVLEIAGQRRQLAYSYTRNEPLCSAAAQCLCN